MYQLDLRKLDNDVDYHHKLRMSERAHLSEQIETMILKESTVYKCNDYIKSYRLKKASILYQSKAADSSQKDFNVDGYCRQKMCEWSYRIVDHLNGRRQLVQISQNFVDRFLDQYQCEYTLYKLLCITSLYLAIKVYNRKPCSISSLASLSRGEYSIENIADMEKALLQALDWNICPPTATCFCYHFHAFIPSPPKIKPSVSQTILQRSCFFSELAVMDYSLTVSVNPSAVAFGSLLNVLAGMSTTLFPQDEREKFIDQIEYCTDISHDCDIMKEIQLKLWSLYRQSNQYKMYDSKKIEVCSNVSCKSDDILKHRGEPRSTYSRGRKKTLDESPTCISSTE